MTPSTTAREQTLADLIAALRTAPASAAVLADATDLPLAGTLAALAELQRRGLVRRIAGATAADRDRWAPTVEESLGETIRCGDYHGHQLSGHRRDPESGRFRCYVCDPEIGGLHA